MSNPATQQEFESNQKLFLDIVARYHSDDEFKAKLKADPTGVLRQEGVSIPENAKVELLFNTDKLVHVVLPYMEDDE